MVDKNYLARNVEYLTDGLGKTNISQKLCRNFQNAIIDGKFPVGYMMPNENLASAMLCVGRSTLREAYICLELSGFITRSKAGTFINDHEEIQKHSPFLFKINNIEDFVDVMEFRYMIEGETSSYVAKRATVAEMDELITIHNSMVMMRENLDRFVEYDQMFHMKIAEYSKNKMLFNTLSASKHIINDEIFANLPKELSDKPETVQSIINSHKKILDCIVTRDYKGASLNMREHITKVNFLMKFIPKPVYITEEDIHSAGNHMVESPANTQDYIRNIARGNRDIVERSVNRRTQAKNKNTNQQPKTKNPKPTTASDLLPDNLMLGNLKNTNNLVESLVKSQLNSQTQGLTQEQKQEYEFNASKKIVPKNTSTDAEKRNLSASDLANRINFKPNNNNNRFR